MMIPLFKYVTSYDLSVDTRVSEEHATSIFRLVHLGRLHWRWR